MISEVLTKAPFGVGDGSQRGKPAKLLMTRRAMIAGGLGVGTAIFLSGCAGRKTAGAPLELSGPPRSGGEVSIGFVGGGAADTLDGAVATNLGDIARAVNLYSTLFTFDHDYQLQPMLAVSAKPSGDSTRWAVVLRDDVKFSDGRPLTPDDVIASIERIVDPENPKSGAASLAHLEGVVKTGPKSLEFQLNTPDTGFDELLAQYSMTIVPADFDVEKPVGTGPFMLESFTAAQSTVMVRNPHYWGDEGPYLDRVTLLNFNDTDALINALLSNQVDAVAQIPSSLVEVIAADQRINILESETGMYMPFTMRVDRKPFDDERVRAAFRLAVDREGMVEQVLSGKGVVGNDMYSVFESSYPRDLPQRKQDIAEAKRLLEQAGYPDGIDVELVTAPMQAGVVEAAQVFAEQVSAAGIRVKINRMDLTAYWSDYLNYDFSQSFWYTRNFMPQTASGMLPDSPFNETNFADKEFVALVDRIRVEADESQRKELTRRAQQILYDRGGLIIWGFANQLDAYQAYLGGFVPDRSGLPLSGFKLHEVWIGEVA